MKTLRKADYVILVILLVLVAGIVLLVMGNRNTGTHDEGSVNDAAELTYADYNGKRLGIMLGSSFESITQEYFPDSSYFYFESTSDLITALEQDKIDGFIDDEPVAKMVHSGKSKVDYIHEPILHDDYCFGFNKSERADKLLEEFNAYLAEIKADGSLDVMCNKWFGSDESAKKVDMSGLTGENGNINVVVLPDNVPFAYYADNELQGYAVEMTIGFARKYGYSVTFEATNSTGCMAGLVSGRYDFYAGSMSITEERKQTVNFSDSFYNGGMVLVVKASDLGGMVQEAPDVNYTDYNGKKIGILTGTNMEAESFKYFPDSEYLYYDGYPNLNTALVNGTIDAFLGDEPALKCIHAEQPKIDFIKERLTNNQYSFAFRKDEAREQELCDQLNAFLRKSNADGTIAEIDAIWFGTDESKKVVDMSDLTGENGTIRVVTTSTDEPFSYIKDGKHVGYDIDVAVRFCREYGYAIEIGDVDFQARIPALASGKYDFTTSMNVTPEREEEVMFSDPVSSGGIVVAVRAEDLGTPDSVSKTVNPRFTSPMQLNDPACSVGFATGSTGMFAVEALLPDAQQIAYDDLMTAYEAVRLGKIDAFVFDRNQMEIALKNGVSGMELLDENLGDPIYVAVGISRKTRIPDLQEKLNAFIDKSNENGTLDDAIKRWRTDQNYTMPDIPVPASPEQKIVVGTTAMVEPYSFYANNELTGFDIELAKRFAAEMNAEVEFRVYNFAGVIAAAEAGEIDCIFSNLNITEERAEVIDFSDPVYITYNGVAVAAQEDTSAAVSKGGWLDSIKLSFEKNFIRESRWKLIAEGIRTTCIITVLAVLFGTLLAFLICLFRRTDSVLANKIADLYVKLLQGTPMVVLLMILYYIIFGKSSIAALWVAVIGFSLNFAAYTSEIMRSGIESIDKGQHEAAVALGFSDNQAFFRFIFPQAAIRQLSVYRGEIISLLKNTSIVGYIAIQDLTKMSDIIRSRTYEAFFPLIATALIYFILAWIITLLLKLLLRQIDPRKRKRAVKGVTSK